MKTKALVLSALLLTLLLLAGQGALPTYAAGYTVNSLADSVANDNVCTLREAIQEANNGADTDCSGSPSAADDTITFGVSGTIYLGSTLPTIVSGAGTLTIDGTGRTIIISGDSNNNGIPDVRVMVVNSGANLTLQNLTIAKGNASGTSSGGGIINYGTLSITNSTFFANYSANDGGGVLNYFGTLTITNSTFSGNYASTNGAGVVNSFGAVTITNSTFSGNSASRRGGGVYNDSGGTLTITGSTFSANSAGSGGGVYSSNGTLTITNGAFSGNSATSKGGGVYNDNGTLTITNSTFSGNSADYGGGVYNYHSTLTMTGSTFSGNSADYGYGGGVYSYGTLTITDSTFSQNTAGRGGGVHNEGMLAIANSTFSANSAIIGGGVWNNGMLTITNSTFSQNTANSGGGVYNDEASLTIINSTFSGNSASIGGGVYDRSIPDIPMTLKNTLIANSTSGGDCVTAVPLSGTNINNLIEDVANACGLTNGVNGNIIGVDPNLGALTGSPAYFPLNAGSPAIDKGDNATCAAPPVYNHSQNGVTRPTDGDGNGTATCDIGSYEAPTSCTAKPAKPTLTAPANNATLTQTKVNLTWNDVTCETQYKVMVKNAATNTTVFKKTLNADVTQVKTKALARGQTYRWFVKACNSFGCAKSAKWTFKVQ